MKFRTMAAGAAGCAALVALATPAWTKPANPGSQGKGKDKGRSEVEVSTTVPGSTATSTTTTAPGGTATSPVTTAPARHKGKFVYVGTLKAVGADSVTIAVQGGNQKAKSSTVVVKVGASAKITRNGRKVKLAQLQVGDHVEAKGVNDTAADVKAQARGASAGSTTSTTSTTAPGGTATSTTTTAPGGTATSTTTTTAH